MAAVAGREASGLGRLRILGRQFEEAGHHSWWDYRLSGFERGWGLRIDLVLVSEALKARCTAAGIAREPRGWERPSDHTPVFVEIADA